MSEDSLYVGLISGTSMDAVDCAVVSITNGIPNVVATHAHEIPAQLKASLLALCNREQHYLRLLGVADIAIAELFAEAVSACLKLNGIDKRLIKAIGSHGQTVWHEPPQYATSHPFTIQIGDPNTIAERTGVTTIADFRRRDMAAGGQGAPIVPALHQAIFQNAEAHCIVLNLGGIANITYLPCDGSKPTGLDTGPASVLMDGWIARHKQVAYDNLGNWAASAQPDTTLLERLMAETYFSMPAPKSTGRELFNLVWLDEKLNSLSSSLAPEVIQATLLELTIESITREVKKLVNTGEILVCGGGARNLVLIDKLRTRLSSFTVNSTASKGIDADFVEATAFAWFASKTLKGETIDFSPFTGARHAVIAGGIYRA